MCGIIGIWSKEDKAISPYSLKKMLNLLDHRGPDAEGIWRIRGLGLGNKRLKILDLTDAGNQPFTDGKDVLVFNGRIFNYLELKKKLSSCFQFKTTCDTEVLFRALQTWREKTFNFIKGQFSFAFYHSLSKTLLLARDHVGICPLYTLETRDEFFFASEIKPLLAVNKCSLDKNGVVDYFAYRYNIQNGRTFFKEIKRFPAAHFLTINLRTREKSTRRYWRLKIIQKQRSKKEIQKEFNKIINNEISKQSMTDVPVGMYLSGGIDSGALLYGFNRARVNINSFTLSFGKKDQDYLRVLSLVKKIKFKRNLVKFKESDLDNLEKAIKALEEPFGDLIICANFLLARKASKEMKVVLSGEGGDEAFCGYDHQRAFFRLLKLSKFALTKTLFSFALKILPPKIFGFFQSYPGKFSEDELIKINNVWKKIHNPLKAYLELISLFQKDDLKKLFTLKFKNQVSIKPDTKPLEEIFSKEKRVWQAVMRSEIEQLTLIINLLKQDRFAMHFSMEGCVPFVSRKILEFAASLPYTIHNSKINKKLLLQYSHQPAIKKKPFSLFSTQKYLKKIIRLMDKYVTYKKVKASGVLSWQSVRKIRLNLLKGNIIAVKQAMSILIFMVWWKCFSPYLKRENI